MFQVVGKIAQPNIGCKLYVSEYNIWQVNFAEIVKSSYFRNKYDNENFKKFS